MIFPVHPSAPRRAYRRLRNLVPLAVACLLTAACTSDYGPHAMPSGYSFHNDRFKSPPGPEPVYKNWDHYPKTGVAAVAPIYQSGMAASYVPAPPSAPVPPPAIMPAVPVPAAVVALTPPPAPAALPDTGSVIVDSSVIGAPPLPLSAPSLAPMEGGNELWYSAAKELVSRVFGQMGKPREAVYLAAGSGSPESNARYGRVLHDIMGQLGIPLASSPAGYTLRYSAGAPDANGRTLLTLTLVSGQQIAAEEAGIFPVASSGGGQIPAFAAAPAPGAPMPLISGGL